MQDFEQVATSDEVTASSGHLVEVGGREVVLVRTADGTVRAFPNTCPHLGQPLRSGFVNGTTLECPFHFYAYDLTSGRNTFPGDDTRDLALQLYEVREEDGVIGVHVPADTPPQRTSAEPPVPPPGI